jgi:hypothetical protein
MTWPPATHQDVEDDLDDAHGAAASLVDRLQHAEHTATLSALLWITGRYYGANLLGTSSNVTITSGRLHLFPMYFARSRSIDRLAFSVTTAGTGGHVARAGVYAADTTTNFPTGAPLLDAGSFAVDSTGIKETAVSVTLHGLVWFAFTAQSGTFHGWSNTMAPGFLGASTGGASAPQNNIGYDTINATSALPTLPGAYTLVTNPGTSVASVMARAA